MILVGMAIVVSMVLALGWIVLWLWTDGVILPCFVFDLIWRGLGWLGAILMNE